MFPHSTTTFICLFIVYKKIRKKKRLIKRIHCHCTIKTQVNSTLKKVLLICANSFRLSQKLNFERNIIWVNLSVEILRIVWIHKILTVKCGSFGIIHISDLCFRWRKKSTKNYTHFAKRCEECFGWCEKKTIRIELSLIFVRTQGNGVVIILCICVCASNA